MSSTAFDRAVAYVSSSTVPSSNEHKLRLYALYKAATSTRTPTAPRPGLLDFSGRAKWDAWSRFGTEDEWARLSDDEAREGARRAYIDEARRLGFVDGTEVLQERLAAKKDHMVAVSTLEDSFVDEAPPSRVHELAIDGDVAALEDFLAGDGKAADLDERDAYGYAPLHLATDRGHAEVVKVLLAHGADRSLPDEDGNTALDLARLAEHDDLVSLLS